MNNYINNEKDLTRIFDKRWKVNKETSKIISEHNQKIKDMVFKTGEKKESQPINYKQENLQRLNNQINQLKNINRDKFRG